MGLRSTRRQAPAKLPSYVRYLDEVAKTNVRGARRAILLAAARWLDWEKWVLWPAVSNWAEMAGIDVRTLQRGLDDLESTGLVQQLDWDTVTYGPTYDAGTNLYRMLPLTSVTSEVDGTPGGERRGTAGGWPEATNPPGVGPPKPSIPRTYQEQNIEPSYARESKMDRSLNTEKWIASIGNAADGRAALGVAGIKGDNLRKLARMDIPPAAIAEEARSLRDEKGIKNLQAVLVHRLQLKYGSLVVVEPEIAKAVAQLEDIRRRASQDGAMPRPSPCEGGSPQGKNDDAAGSS